MTEGQNGHWLKHCAPETLDRLAETMAPVPNEEQMEYLVTKLTSFGLEDWEVLVLISKDVAKLTYREIAQDHGFTGVTAVHRIYKIAQEKARRGYLRGKKNG